MVRESTKQGNDKVARQMEAAHRTSLAKGEVGIRDKKPALTLAEFLKHRIEPWASRRSSWIWYRAGIGPFFATSHSPICDWMRSRRASWSFAAHRQSEGLQVGSINFATSSTPGPPTGG